MTKTVAVAIMVAVAVVAAYFASPYWAIHQMRSAGEAGEGDKVASYVDFPAVRESIKTQMITQMDKSMKDVGKDNPFAALGQAFAGRIVNGMVDSLVTPEWLAGMVSRGKRDKQGPNPTAPPTASATTLTGKPPRIQQGYEGLDIFKVTVHDVDVGDPMVTLVLGREGIFSWKLKSIRMRDFDMVK
ncbi:MAG: DUF2939 domain-containing protein [Casimicrobiaceae bacterium]